MVSREDRDALIGAINRYTSEQITAFHFDDALTEIRAQTQDQTVQWATQALWLFYDDLQDHKVAAAKEEWDFFQRLLLLLHSDGELVFSTRREWTIRQPLAALTLAGFVWAVSELGFGRHLLGLAIPFGLISILLARWQRWSTAREGDWRRYPFSSLAEALAVRRRCPSFKKQRYPLHLAQRTIRSQATGCLAAVPSYCLWLFLSPVLLAFQMLPEKQTSHSIAFS